MIRDPFLVACLKADTVGDARAIGEGILTVHLRALITPAEQCEPRHALIASARPKPRRRR